MQAASSSRALRSAVQCSCSRVPDRGISAKSISSRSLNRATAGARVARRGVAELARLPEELPAGQERRIEPVGSDTSPQVPYLPPRQPDGRIPGIPFPRGEVATKPVFQWDESLTERENLRREKLHEKWRKRNPYATQELYAHHVAEQGATGTKAGLVVIGAVAFLVTLAYINAERVRREAARRQVMAATPPERPPRAPPATGIDADGLAGDNTLQAIGQVSVPALDQPAAVPVAPLPAARDERLESWRMQLERGNNRLI